MSEHSFGHSGKTAIVTSASHGLGSYYARALGGAGADLVITSLLEAALAHYSPIDTLVDNAGVNVRKPALEVSRDDWNTGLDTARAHRRSAPVTPSSSTAASSPAPPRPPSSPMPSARAQQPAEASPEWSHDV